MERREDDELSTRDLAATGTEERDTSARFEREPTDAPAPDAADARADLHETGADTAIPRDDMREADVDDPEARPLSGEVPEPAGRDADADLTADRDRPVAEPRAGVEQTSTPPDGDDVVGGTSDDTARHPAAAGAPAEAVTGDEGTAGEQDAPTRAEAAAGPGTAAEASTGDGEAASLLSDEDSDDFQRRWERIQTQFVDEPRGAVEDADSLVAAVMKRVAEGFAQEREQLEGQWGRGEDISTEDLRVALQRYRVFFRRLLSA